ncbi:MAG: 30S ribosomal protein S8 [Deltaproteobacteria bacterium]|nr:30S ribosomal protein S8 [Deltaproteobacteria bacterium]
MKTDSIADLLTRIRNAQRAGHKTVRVQKSNQGARVLEVLKTEGFIDHVETKLDADDKFEEFEVFLKYYSSGQPAINGLRRVSRPGKRVYSGTTEIPRVEQGLGISIVSTSQGVMSDREARRRKIGGEVLAVIS